MVWIRIAGLPEQMGETLLKADGMLTTAAGQFQYSSCGGQQLAQQVSDRAAIAFCSGEKGR